MESYNYKNNFKLTIVFSIFWKLLEKIGTQGAGLLIQILLARLLLPEYFGLIAIVTVFIAFANVFVQSGLNTALIQSKNISSIDYSSVFYFSLCVSGLFYLLIFFLSPVFADFYHNHQLTLLLRVLSLTLFIGAYNSIQTAFLARNMLFKKLFIGSFIALIISGTISIITAYHGSGIWSLVIYQLTNQLTLTVALQIMVKWRPEPFFSCTRLKLLFSFGWKILIASLLNAIHVQIRPLLIGKVFNPLMLGYYDRGNQIPLNLATNIDGALQNVMLPAMASQQDNIKMVKEMMRRAIKTSSFLLFPIMAGLAVIAEPLVKLILTEKWLPSVPFLQIFCIVYALYPIHTVNLQAINAIGRSDIFLRLEIIKLITGIAILLISLNFGIYAVAWGMVLMSVTGSFINAFPSKKLLSYSYMEQIKDIAPSCILSLVMAGAVYSLRFLNLGNAITLGLQILVGATVFYSLAFLIKLESLVYLFNILKEIVINLRTRNNSYTLSL